MTDRWMDEGVDNIPSLKHWYNEISCFIFKEKFENSIYCDAQAVQVFVGHSQHMYFLTLHQHSGSVGRASTFLQDGCGFDPSKVIPKTVEMVLTALSLGAQHYGSRARDQNCSSQCQYNVIRLNMMSCV